MDFSESFKSPAFGFRAKPFWAWNGNLEKDELLRQINVIKEMGFGGFFMHSRTGLATEYLGKEWFELINACADRAKELGLEAWLYDEDRWPSGTAGGEVTKNPDFRMRSLLMTRVSAQEADLEGSLAVFSITEENGLLTGYQRIQTNSDKEKYYGQEVLKFSVEEMEKSSFYNGYTYVDTLNSDATQCFLEHTHEKYYEKCGDRIGDSILGIFTDEPHRGSLMCSFGQGLQSKESKIPFTGRLPDTFQEKYNYDLIEKLPELFLKTNVDGIAPIKWQYVELVEEMFLNNYAKPIDKWCRDHHLILTGHMLQENSLISQTAMSGSAMRYYEYMEYPGIDFLGEHDRSYWIAKQLQSVARQLDKKILLSELDGCTGWQMNFENYKAVGDWQALYGINLRCPHLSWYTMEGQAKRDYPASIFHQSAWWKEYSYLENYYARIASFTEHGTPCCHVLVINPVESVWARVAPGWCDGLEPREKRVVELEQNYENIFNWLQRSHIDFDYGDEDIMLRHGRTENGMIFVGQAAYAAVVISGMDTIRSSTIKLLKKFASCGGKIILCGEPPHYVDCIKCETEWNAVSVSASEKDLAAALSEYAVEIIDGDGNSAEKILCQMKEQDGTMYVMLINDDREHAIHGAVLKMKSLGTVTRFIPETGEIEVYPFERESGTLKIPLDFEPAGEYLLAVGQEFPIESKAEPFHSDHESVLEGDFQYELDEKNICVLDFARVSIDGGAYTEPLEILKADRHIRTHFALPFRGGEMLQPWFVKQREMSDNGTVNLQFAFDVRQIPSSQVLLVMEEAEMLSAFVSINGVPLIYQTNDFRWADICYKSLEIPAEYLRSGENIVELQISYNETTNLESMFLFGDFGVELDGNRRILTMLPETLKLGNIVDQGLPFYSGELTYRYRVAQTGAKHVILKLESFAGACVKVEGNGKKEIIAWKPYEVDVTDLVEDGALRVTVVLTRRNTFGPLHQVPAVWDYCGPEHFETEGKYFSTDYSLVQAGLIGPVKILY